MYIDCTLHTLSLPLSAQSPPLETLVHLVQDVLRKKNYTSFGKVQEALEYHDAEGTGFLSANQIRHLFRHFEVPLADQLVDAVIMK